MSRFGQGIDGAARDCYLDVPVGSGLAKTLTFQLADGTPVDISSSTWTAEIVGTAAVVTVTQPAAHQLLLTGAQAALDTALDGLTGLRWQLWETDAATVRRPRLAGPVNRHDPGFGETSGGTGDITVTVAPDGQVVTVAAVVTSLFAATVDEGGATAVYAPGTNLDEGGA